jgi:hypothetical protein
MWMNDIVFKSISVIEGNATESGHYFYNSPYDSDYGHIYGVIGLTLPKALEILKKKGIDYIKNQKVSISVFYY